MADKQLLQAIESGDADTFSRLVAEHEFADFATKHKAMSFAVQQKRFAFAKALKPVRVAPIRKTTIAAENLSKSAELSGTLLHHLTLPPNHLVGNRPRPELYRWKNDASFGWHVIENWATHLLGDDVLRESARKAGFVSGMAFYNETLPSLQCKRQDHTPSISIAYTLAGTRGPIVVFLHGVPTNRKQWQPVQMLLAPFCRTLSLDFLGLGESSKPLGYPEAGYDWKFDVAWIEHTVQKLFPDERFVFVADDWGAGPAQHYAERYGSGRLLGLVLLNPIAMDGYPVSEIQAIGRDLYGAYKAAYEDVEQNLPEWANATDQLKRGAFHPRAVESPGFIRATAGFDQTLVQIYKTMVSSPSNVYNQYSLRTIKEAYVDTDYDRLGPDAASSTTLRLHHHAIAVLAIRASRLSPSQLLPYHQELNPEGLHFEAINMPVMILWGEDDTMMPANQAWRFQYALDTSPLVHTHQIPRAGHYAATDQPDLVAEELLKFIRQLVGTGISNKAGGFLRKTTDSKPLAGLAQAFVGYTGIWKGDEEQLLDGMNSYYRIPSE